MWKGQREQGQGSGRPEGDARAGEQSARAKGRPRRGSGRPDSALGGHRPGPKPGSPWSRGRARMLRRQIRGSAERREPEASRGRGGERKKELEVQLRDRAAAAADPLLPLPSGQVTASHLGCRSLQHMLMSLPGPVQGLPPDVTQSQAQALLEAAGGPPADLFPPPAGAQRPDLAQPPLLQARGRSSSPSEGSPSEASDRRAWAITPPTNTPPSLPPSWGRPMAEPPPAGGPERPWDTQNPILPAPDPEHLPWPSQRGRKTLPLPHESNC